MPKPSLGRVAQPVILSRGHGLDQGEARCRECRAPHPATVMRILGPDLGIAQLHTGTVGAAAHRIESSRRHQTDGQPVGHAIKQIGEGIDAVGASARSRHRDRIRSGYVLAATYAPNSPATARSTRHRPAIAAAPARFERRTGAPPNARNRPARTGDKTRRNLIKQSPIRSFCVRGHWTGGGQRKHSASCAAIIRPAIFPVANLCCHDPHRKVRKITYGEWRAIGIFSVLYSCQRAIPDLFARNGKRAMRYSFMRKSRRVGADRAYESPAWRSHWRGSVSVPNVCWAACGRGGQMGSTRLVATNGCHERQCIDAVGIFRAQRFVRRLRPMHAFIEGVALDGPAVANIGAVPQRMNPVAFGRCETGRIGLAGKFPSTARSDSRLPSFVLCLFMRRYLRKRNNVCANHCIAAILQRDGALHFGDNMTGI